MSEHKEQAKFIQWCNLHCQVLTAVDMVYANANGGHLKHIKGGIKLKAEGVKAGVPDIFLAYPTRRYAGLYIEFKYGKNKTSDAQEEWIAKLKARGYCCRVAYSFEAGVAETLIYLASEFKITYKPNNYYILKAEPYETKRS